MTQLVSQRLIFKSGLMLLCRLRSGPRPTPSSILINCHFDSVPLSPGASDDAVNCGIMLETMRALAATPRGWQEHDLVFLFNGAEEMPLPASHGFITQVFLRIFCCFGCCCSLNSFLFPKNQHPWAKGVAAFVNLEAAGAGAGREILFQVCLYDHLLHRKE